MQQPQQQQNGSSILVQGRIVWTSGNLFEGKKMTDDAGKPITDENGQQCVQFGFGLSVPKIDPRTGQYSEQFNTVWQALHKEAFTIYPSGQLPPDFAMKYKDGDALDHNGKPFADREGYKGCIVLACTTQIPIKYFKWEGNTNILVNDGIKCGDYVNVQLNIKAHAAKGRGKPGLYLNPSACQLITPGKEIINAPSGDQMFGMAAPVYHGEVVAPVAPVMPQGMPTGPAMPGMPGGMGQAPMMPQQPQYPQQGQAPVDPHYGILPQTHQPQGNVPQMPMQGAPAVNGQIQYPQTNTVAPMVPGQQYVQPAYPSNPQYPQQQPQYPQQGGGMPQMPAMPGMPR